MFKKTITYTDYDGNERTEDFYFNLTEAEITEMEFGVVGGMTKKMQKIVQEQDGRKIIETFKDLINRSYGVKSADGRRFEKTKENLDAFTQTEAYSNLFMELATNADAASEFFNGIIPKSMEKKKPADTKQ